jgi:hypothetical protein
MTLDMETAMPHDPTADPLVLQHAACVDDRRMPAYSRLEQTLGGRLTALLVSALATGLLRRDGDTGA